MIEGTTQTRIDIMNLPEHSKKSCTGKNRRKVLQNLQKNVHNFRPKIFSSQKTKLLFSKTRVEKSFIRNFKFSNI